MDIVWSNDGVEFSGHLISLTTNTSVTYVDTYIITQLNTTNEGQQVQCTVVISGLSPVMASDTVTLDVSGKRYKLLYKWRMQIYVSHSPSSITGHIRVNRRIG